MSNILAQSWGAMAALTDVPASPRHGVHCRDEGARPAAGRGGRAEVLPEGATMEEWICVTCGTQYPAGAAPPPACPICEDDRQYIGHDGQRWTTLAEMGREYRNAVREVDPGVTGIATEPRFAIGQQAHLIQTPEGNLLWDCISYLDEATLAEVRRRGGIAAIAISHP